MKSNDKSTCRRKNKCFYEDRIDHWLYLYRDRVTSRVGALKFIFFNNVVLAFKIRYSIMSLFRVTKEFIPD